MPSRSVVLGFSGGIDSVTAATKLKNEGWRVIAVTLDTVGDKAMVEKACSVAQALGIEHKVIDVREPFKQHIIDYFIDSYSSGRTPAPCTLCNPAIKWYWLAHEATRLGIEHIATGHYFRVEKSGDKYYITRPADSTKDQSYYLWGLSQDILQRIITPMAEVIKSDIKENFADKRESMGICFLQGINYREFLQKHCPTTCSKGDIIDSSGEIVGRHSGVAFYTIGQKRGFECRKSNVAVVSIDAENNRLIVGEDSMLYKSVLKITDCNIIDREEFMNSNNISVIIRGIGRNPQGFIQHIEPTDAGFRITLGSPAWAPATGQPVVFYRQNRVIGGGFIAQYY